MKKEIVSEICWSLVKIGAGLLMALFLMLALSSCNANRRIVKTPTHREIKKAMKYSTSEYAMPEVRVTYSHFPISN